MALMSGRYRVATMQFFCLKLHAVLGLQVCAGFMVSGSSGSLVVEGVCLAAA